MLNAANAIEQTRAMLRWRAAEADHLDRIHSYLRGKQPLPIIPAGVPNEVRRLAEMSRVNVLDLVISAVAQSLYVDGYRAEREPDETRGGQQHHHHEQSPCSEAVRDVASEWGSDRLAEVSQREERAAREHRHGDGVVAREDQRDAHGKQAVDPAAHLEEQDVEHRRSSQAGDARAGADRAGVARQARRDRHRQRREHRQHDEHLSRPQGGREPRPGEQCEHRPDALDRAAPPNATARAGSLADCVSQRDQHQRRVGDAPQHPREQQHDRPIPEPVG